MVAPFKVIDISDSELLDTFPDAETILQAAYGPVTDDVIQAYQSTWATWDEKPQIALTQVAPGRYTITFDDSEASKNWEHIDQGSKQPRDILAKTEKGMIFPRDYTPATNKANLVSVKKEKFGPIQRRQRIYNWRVEARDFSSKIEQRAETALERSVAQINSRGRLRLRDLRSPAQLLKSWLSRGFTS